MTGNKVYILGGMQTDFQRNWKKEGKNPVAILREVIDDTLKDCNINIDYLEYLKKQNRLSCFIGNFAGGEFTKQSHSGALLTLVNPVFYGIPSARYEAACASGSVALEAAINQIRLGDKDLALVIGWEMMKSVESLEAGNILGEAAFFSKESEGIEYPFPKLFASLADATIEKYSLNEERYMDNLASISIMNFENAKKNPLAQTRSWYMSYEKAHNRGTCTNPLVGGRLAASDCSQTSDGAAAVILISEKLKKEMQEQDLPMVKGMGCRVAPMLLSLKLKENASSPYILPWTRQTVLDAYENSKLSVSDMDFFETHDCFTSSEYMAISAFGLTEPGKEFEAIESGLIAFDGKKPINPEGGLIGIGHPVGASGVRMFLDLSKQLMQKAGKCQLKNVKNGLMLNLGGSATTNYTFIVGRENV